VVDECLAMHIGVKGVLMHSETLLQGGIAVAANCF